MPLPAFVTLVLAHPGYDVHLVIRILDIIPLGLHCRTMSSLCVLCRDTHLGHFKWRTGMATIAALPQDVIPLFEMDDRMPGVAVTIRCPVSPLKNNQSVRTSANVHFSLVFNVMHVYGLGTLPQAVICLQWHCSLRGISSSLCWMMIGKK
jgi:hypothetical protein